MSFKDVDHSKIATGVTLLSALLVKWQMVCCTVKLILSIPNSRHWCIGCWKLPTPTHTSLDPVNVKWCCCWWGFKKTWLSISHVHARALAFTWIKYQYGRKAIYYIPSLCTGSWMYTFYERMYQTFWPLGKHIYNVNLFFFFVNVNANMFQLNFGPLAQTYIYTDC